MVGWSGMMCHLNVVQTATEEWLMQHVPCMRHVLVLPLQVHDDLESGRGNGEGQVLGGMHRRSVTQRQNVHSKQNLPEQEKGV